MDATTTSGTAAVLARVGRPYEPAKLAAALLGVPLRVGRQLVGAVLATSDEAEDLLDAMPHVLRSLAIATTDRPERCYGELRGPVLWSETMSSRSASAGDPGLFVCATTTKAYDTDENRVLKAALHAVQRAARDADHHTHLPLDELVRRARHNGHHAARLIEHQTLAAVPTVRPDARQLRRTRAGSRRNTYRPALDLLRRSAEPLTAEHLTAFAEPGTLAQHDLLAEVLDTVEGVVGAPIRLRCVADGLTGGGVSYDHLAGVRVGTHPVGGTADLPRALEALA
jgi:hypothetical protein